ncbi:MAG: NAD(P)H-hydrate dehydratase [Leptothrix sp. (in: b-proteobacteria)]
MALHDRLGCAALEQLAASALPAHTLMQRAGWAVAQLALAVSPHAEATEVLAGSGNNGGDGFEAALRLHAAGRRVRVWWLGTPARQPADARASRLAAAAAGVPCVPLDPTAPALWMEALQRAPARTLVIDAAFGRGLSRSVDGALGAILAALNRSRLPTLAVDLPSGLNGDTGAWADASAPVARARWTLALLSPAPGLFTGDSRDAAGEVWWHDLGADPAGAPACAHLERGASVARVLGPRQHQQHKGSFGDVRIVGGAHQMAGAAWLAARAALQCGAGRVYVHGLDADSRSIDAGQPELMLGGPLRAESIATCTVVAGCGGGAAIAAALPLLLQHAQRLLLDADALNAIAANAELANALRLRHARGQVSVLTPHPLEAARLLQCTTREVQGDRLLAAQRIAERWGVVAVLKGSGSVIAAPGHTASINASGNAALATAGSGDVLAGCIGALWGRHAGASTNSVAAASLDDHLQHAFEAAVAGVHLHGNCAEQASAHGEALPASALAQALGDHLRRHHAAGAVGDSPGW